MNWDNKIIVWIIYFLIFLLPFNKNLPIPVDKVAITLLFLFVFLKKISDNTTKTNTIQVLVFFLFFLGVVISLVVNNVESNFLVLFPAIGLGLVLYSEYLPIKIKNIYYFFSTYLLICLILYTYAKIFGYTSYVRALWESNREDIWIPLGFSSTSQIIGTFSVINLLIFYIEKSKKNLKKYDYLILIISIIVIFLTYNRTSQIIFLSILMLNNISLFIFLIVVAFVYVSVMYDKNSFLDLIFSTHSIESRLKFFDGFNYQFNFLSNSLTRFFGNASFNLENITLKNSNALHEYVENGTLAIIHAYGIYGFIMFSLFNLIILNNLFTQKNINLKFIGIIYILIVPQITHEYLNSTYYILLIILNFYIQEMKAIKNK